MTQHRDNNLYVKIYQFYSNDSIIIPVINSIKFFLRAITNV